MSRLPSTPILYCSHDDGDDGGGTPLRGDGGEILLPRRHGGPLRYVQHREAYCTK